MNHCNLQQNAFMSPGPGESRQFVVPVVCPKPRRVTILSNNVVHPFTSHSSQPGGDDVCDSQAGADLLDIIRRKGETLSSAVASSPPFFLGSPPSRVSNPIAQDARFGDEKINPVSPSLSPFHQSPSPSPSSRVKGGGCGGRMKFGLKPAAVRVEGFNCLNRDRQSSNISAMA